jgi:hypothetical protein
MPLTFLDLMVALLWPLVLSAATWAIAIHALAERDQISKVVETLTRPSGVKEKRKAWKWISPFEFKNNASARLVSGASAAHGTPIGKGRKAEQ